MLTCLVRAMVVALVVFLSLELRSLDFVCFSEACFLHEREVVVGEKVGGFELSCRSTR